MKLTLKFTLILFFLLTVGCALHLNPPKVGIDTNLIPALHGDVPVKVVVQENADKNFKIRFIDNKMIFSLVDLNKLYSIAKEIMEDQLIAHHVPVSEKAQKLLKFTITNIECEGRAGGFSIVSFIDFDIETGDGYTHHYRVMEGFGSLHRAVGLTVSKAVVSIFQDAEVLAYIEK